MKTATITEKKVAERKEISRNIRKMMELGLLAYNTIEHETGENLLRNTLGFIPDEGFREVCVRRFTDEKELGFWNWWINYRQQTEQEYMKHLITQGFMESFESNRDTAKEWLLRNWLRIHSEIEVSEEAIKMCGHFIKNKL